MSGHFATTNVFLGIIAAAGVLEALAVGGFLVGAFLVYRRVVKVIADIEQRQIDPAAARINAILDDVRDVTATAKDQARRAESFVNRLVKALQRFRSKP